MVSIDESELIVVTQRATSLTDRPTEGDDGGWRYEPSHNCARVRVVDAR